MKEKYVNFIYNLKIPVALKQKLINDFHKLDKDQLMKFLDLYISKIVISNSKYIESKKDVLNQIKLYELALKDEDESLDEDDLNNMLENI